MVARVLALVAAASYTGLPHSVAAQGEPVALFNGTLAGWTIENAPGGNISIRDGLLRIEAPEGWLRSERSYADFRLRIEFRFLTDDADSGIFLRAIAIEERAITP